MANGVSTECAVLAVSITIPVHAVTISRHTTSSRGNDCHDQIRTISHLTDYFPCLLVGYLAYLASMQIVVTE